MLLNETDPNIKYHTMAFNELNIQHICLTLLNNITNDLIIANDFCKNLRISVEAKDIPGFI